MIKINFDKYRIGYAGTSKGWKISVFHSSCDHHWNIPIEMQDNRPTGATIVFATIVSHEKECLDGKAIIPLIDEFYGEIGVPKLITDSPVFIVIPN